MNKLYFLFFLFLFFPYSIKAQQLQGANWFFGGHGDINDPGMHLNFSGQTPSAQLYNYDHSYPYGVATISDKNGQLLFFSSKGHVATRVMVNGKYQEMPNGDVFGIPDHTTFAELITQDPADDQVYYLFFVTTHYLHLPHHLYVAKVDMRLNNGLGDVVPNSLQLLRRNITAGMLAMLHSNNRDTWIVTQNLTSDTIQAHLVSPTGIGAPVITLTNNPRTYITDTRMKSSPNSEMFVVKGTHHREVKVYQFNRSLGTTSLLHNLGPAQPNYGNFSYAFSPDNTKLYVGTTGLVGATVCQSYIYQYNLTAGSTQQVQQSVYSIPIPTCNSIVFDMQLAIDGKIYIARNDTVLYLSRLNCPNLSGPDVGFELRAIKMLGSVSYAMLPALNQTIFRNAGILQANAQQDTICHGSSVQLHAYGAGASRFRWQPANGLRVPSDTLANPVVNPTTTTTYTVTGSGACHTTLTASVTVVVLPKPTAITLSGPASVCPQLQSVWYRANNPQNQPLSWGVKGGIIDTIAGDSISVNWGNASSLAQIWALPKNHKGCPGDTVFFPVNITVVLATETPEGADTLCLASAQNIAYHIGSTTNSVYTWGIQGGSIASGQGTAAIKVNWSQPGTGKIWVNEESQTSTSLCRGLSDTLRVLIHPSPASILTISGPAQVFTLAENQEYRLLGTDSTSSFNWSVTGGQISSGQGNSSIKVDWNGPGTGLVKVTERNQFGCPGKEAAFTVQVSGSPQPVFYNIITPNNDGRNDIFTIENLKWYPENELRIFNRWGGEVYRKINYQNNWQAENLYSGGYYFYFMANGQNWKGWFELVK